MPLLEGVVRTETENVADLNITALRTLLDRLQLRTDHLVRASDLCAEGAPRSC